MIGEDRLAESHATRIFVNDAAGVQKPDMNRVKMGLIQIPKLHVAEMRELNSVARRVLGGLCRSIGGRVRVGIECGLWVNGAGRANLARLLLNNLIAVT